MDDEVVEAPLEHGVSSVGSDDVPAIVVGSDDVQAMDGMEDVERRRTRKSARKGTDPWTWTWRGHGHYP